MFLNGYALHEEPCTDPYARFCGQTEAAVSSDPIRFLVPDSHSACVFTERILRSENAGFTKWRKVIAKLSCAPFVGCTASEAGRIGAVAGIGGRVVFADFSSRSPEKSFAKIATPRRAYLRRSVDISVHD